MNPQSHDVATLDLLINKNQLFVDQYQSNALMDLIASEDIANKEVRVRLLDCIQVFSNFFQKTVMIRHIFTDCQNFSKITQQHLDEEYGHDKSLMRDRNHMPPVWDPVLESTSCWFAWKMLIIDNLEKTVLMHLVLEASANSFFKRAHGVMQRFRETDYFKRHADADKFHEEMGIELLKNLTPGQYEKLFEIQKQGWSMLNAVCDRIAYLSINHPS